MYFRVKNAQLHQWVTPSPKETHVVPPEASTLAGFMVVTVEENARAIRASFLANPTRRSTLPLALGFYMDFSIAESVAAWAVGLKFVRVGRKVFTFLRVRVSWETLGLESFQTSRRLLCLCCSFGKYVLLYELIVL